MTYPGLRRPPETEMGATIHAPSVTPSVKGKRAQAEAIGSHSRKHLPEDPSHKMTTQVDYNWNFQKGNKEAVKCGSTSGNHKGKHSPKMKSCATSPRRTTDYRDKGQGNNATPDTPRKGYAGRIAIRNDWWPTVQKQSEKQTWQRTTCQDRKQHAITRIRRTEQCLLASPSSSIPLENHQGTAIGTSTPTNTITVLSASDDHANGPQPQLLLETETQGFQSTGISTIDDLPMDRWGPATHHYTRKETLLPNKGTIKAPEVATPLKEQECSLTHDDLELLIGRRPFPKISI
jgi:hypothetical protein